MIYIYEDNAGGLHMTDHGVLHVYMGRCGDGASPGKLLEDLATYHDWCYDASDFSAEPTADYDAIRLVADRDRDGTITLYPQRMGRSAMLYAGL